MKKNDIITLALNLIKQNKIKSTIYFIVIFLLMLLGNVAINFNYNINNFIENTINNDINGRKLFVHKIDTSTGKLYDYNKLIEELDKYEHIEYFYNTDYNYQVAKFNFNDNISISLLPLKKGMILNTIYGRNIKSNNEIICPLFITPNNNDKVENLIDMKDFLNKEVTLSYEQLRVINVNKIILENEFNRNFKIVGLYQSVFSSTDNNNCYMLDGMLKMIHDESSTIYNDEYQLVPNSRSTIVIVDKVENVNTVYQELINNGFSASVSLEIDYPIINMFKYISYVILFLILICILIITNIYIKNIIKDKEYEIGLYKSFGYKNKTIVTIFKTFITIITLLAYIIGVIILLIIIHISNNIISSYISLSLLTLKLSFIIEIIYTTLIFSVFYINIFILSRKIYKMEVRDILNENDI